MAPKLPAIVETLDAIPEAYREIYEKRDGKFYINLDGFDYNALHEKNRLKAAYKDLEAKVAAYQALGDPESLAAMKDAQSTLLEERQRQAGETDKIIASQRQQIVTEKDKELSVVRAEAARYKSELELTLIDGTAQTVINAEGGYPELLMPHIRRAVKVDANPEGRLEVVILGTDGAPRVKADGSAFTMRDLVLEMKQDPILGRAFPPRGVGGSGAPIHQLGGAGGGSAALTERLRKLPAVERLAEARRHGIR